MTPRTDTPRALLPTAGGGGRPLLLAIAAAALLLAPPAFAGPATFERLLAADREPQNWLMTQQNYSGWRHSGLDEINRTNVAKLKLAFLASIGGRATGEALAGREEATPIVNDGILYVPDGWARVTAFDVTDAAKGAVPLWRFDPKLVKARSQRGVCALDDTIFIATYDARLVALSRLTGEEIFEKHVAAPPDPVWGTPTANTEGFSAACQTLRSKGGRDLVVQGEFPGGATGMNSWIGAFDARSGDLAWRFFTIPRPGEPGSETWKDSHGAWRMGGGGVWSTSSFDPELNLVFNGTGDPSPTSQIAFRPGDNLYAASVVANDVDTGKLAWYFQETPNERWDFDTPGTKLLVAVGGRAEVAEFARNGFFYQFDRRTGAFLRADPYQAEVTWTKGLDPKTGRPIDYDPTVGIQDYATPGQRSARLGTRLCPGPEGPRFYPPTFDPDLSVAFVAGAESCAGEKLTPRAAADKSWVERQTCCAERIDVGRKLGQGANLTLKGTIWAFDIARGKASSKAIADTTSQAGLLGTKGGLLFTGEHDGAFEAYDKSDLKKLWSYPLGTSICAPPITYAVRGKQYVVVLAGCTASPDTPLVQPSAFLAFFTL